MWVTSIQVADETFVAAAPDLAREALGDRARWARWWPDLSLAVVEDRGAQGLRWTVSGPVDGTMEVWCEPVMDGFVLHYFLHGEPTGRLPRRPRALYDELAEMNRRRRVAGKVMAFEIKWRLEQHRQPGDPAAPAETATGGLRG
ncbi:hypothetical protein GOARA_089_00280 [Gordonia araii NBRC 100433]|uniref:Polyketide cyclase / dehydrase and lipid transport n=1 Tax=Gordonia araii NBRC 100433 TaxID=1073574 RepID=G7H7M1_9ACTN|nr:hypothetical protein [Gordonia araii]NNG97868.1 hypothetical protein [Gordonia araii NBRC 100433]GAB11846.1 hypothetical protein GOARA_089_00280 [Gordonia araii NBRC 100433]